MGLQKFSEPSSPNPSQTSDLESSPNLNWIDGGSGDELNTSIPDPIGYVLLGSEVVHTTDERDSEAEDETNSDESTEVEHSTPNSIPHTEKATLSSTHLAVSDSSSASTTTSVLDALLYQQLQTSDLEPRGAFNVSWINSYLFLFGRIPLSKLSQSFCNYFLTQISLRQEENVVLEEQECFIIALYPRCSTPYIRCSETI